MVKPVTMYRGKESKGNIYPDEVEAWKKEGWSLTQGEGEPPTLSQLSSQQIQQPQQKVFINFISEGDLVGLGLKKPSDIKLITEKQPNIKSLDDISGVKFNWANYIVEFGNP